MTIQVEVKDQNWVVLGDDALMNLRTREQITFQQALDRGVVAEIKNPEEYYGGKAVEIFQRWTQVPPHEVRSALIGVITAGATPGELPVINMTMIGTPANLRATIIALISEMRRLYPEAHVQLPDEPGQDQTRH